MAVKPACNIFVVEPDPFYGAVLAKFLEQFSNNIHVFMNGKDCISQFHLVTADAVLLDYNHAQTQQSVETLKYIREVYPHIPVIFLADQGTTDIAVTSLKYGATDYFEKNHETFDKLSKVFRKIFSLRMF